MRLYVLTSPLPSPYKGEGIRLSLSRLQNFRNKTFLRQSSFKTVGFIYYYFGDCIYVIFMRKVWKFPCFHHICGDKAAL